MISNIKLISNKIYVGIFNVFNVRIIRIIFRLLFIKSNLFFFENCDLKVLAIFLLFTFFLEFALIFSIIYPKKKSK